MREQTCFGVPCHGFDNEECNRNKRCTAVVYVSSAILCPPVPSKPRQGPIEPSLLLKPLSQRAIPRQECRTLMLLWRPFRRSTEFGYAFALQMLCPHSPREPQQWSVEPPLLFKSLSQRANPRQECHALMLLWRPLRRSTEFGYAFEVRICAISGIA